MNFDGCEPIEFPGETVEDPPRQKLASRILEPRNLIEEAVVKLLMKWGERPAQVCEVEHPAGVVHFTVEMDLDSKRMTV